MGGSLGFRDSGHDRAQPPLHCLLLSFVSSTDLRDVSVLGEIDELEFPSVECKG